MKRNLIKIIRTLRKNKIENVFSILLSIIIILFIIGYFHFKNTSWENITNDVSKEILITSLGVVCAALITLFLHRLILLIMTKVEDTIKLNPDYAILIHNYKGSLKKFLSIPIPKDQIKKIRRKSFSYLKEDDVCIIPEEYIFLKKRHEKLSIRIKDDNEKRYQMPDELSSHFNENMKAHGLSYIYNSILVRVDDYTISQEENSICLLTSRTTYFESLATNRSIDYTWENGLCIRDLYTFNHRIQALKDMPLSNHLGINGIVKTKDDYIICIYRSDEASIGKGTYSISLGAAIQINQTDNSYGIFDKAELKSTVKNVIEDELGISQQDYRFEIEDNIIAFYRDWVEGGKPQLLFYVDCLLNAEKIEEKFNEANQVANKRMELISLVDLQHAIITADYILLNTASTKKKVYKVLPSVAGSVYVYLSYFKE